MSSSSILLSIVIPVYNSISSLEECVKSIWKAHINSSEIILVDDGSIDGSSELCDYICSIYKNVIVYHKSNGGAASARNYGLEKARGKYISFIDSDDKVFSQEYADIFFDAYLNNVDIACYDMLVGDNYITCNSRNNLWDNFIHSSIYMHSLCNKFFKCSVIYNLRFEEQLSVCEDMLFCAQAFIKSDKIVYYKKLAYYYSQNPQSVTHTLDNYKKTNDDILSADLINSIYKDSESDKYFLQFINYRKQIAALRFLTEIDIFSPKLYRRTITSKTAYRLLNNRKHRCLCWFANYRIDCIPFMFILLKSLIKG